MDKEKFLNVEYTPNQDTKKEIEKLPENKESLPKAIKEVLKDSSSFKAPNTWKPKTVKEAIDETLEELKAL